MVRFTLWLQHHHLSAFFVLAYAISWGAWPLYASGLTPDLIFLNFGPLAAALIVTTLAWGSVGFKAWARLLIRWRVGWTWYGVALLLPVMMVLVAAFVNVSLGAARPGLADVVATGLLFGFALRLVDPLQPPVGEEPGFRGYAAPLLQRRRSPVLAAVVLGVLVAGWHLPLVVTGRINAIWLPCTVVITFLYVWLFNRTGGSVLLTMLFHNSQATVTLGTFGFSGPDLGRGELIYCAVLIVAAAATIVLDPDAWRISPQSAGRPLRR